ncbi:ribonuclease P protein component [Candidatus Sumerlaeota bacterium]|nr:ribonuclease P protein component [Candidatus Sumerlaeota bacterium]
MNLTFPGAARLRRRAEYHRVYSGGKCARHPWLVLFCLPSADGTQASTRFGFTVSRKISKRATERNRVRRVWQEAVRLTRPHFASGWDIVLNARRVPTEDLRTAGAMEVLLSLARQLALLETEAESQDP